VDIILALTALFNFTRLRDGDIVDNYICIAETDIEDIQPLTLESIESTSTNNKTEARSMNILRDKIAEDMWEDYQQFINQ
jgi:hypothetical protein